MPEAGCVVEVGQRWRDLRRGREMTVTSVESCSYGHDCVVYLDEHDMPVLASVMCAPGAWERIWEPEIGEVEMDVRRVGIPGGGSLVDQIAEGQVRRFGPPPATGELTTLPSSPDSVEGK